MPRAELLERALARATAPCRRAGRPRATSRRVELLREPVGAALRADEDEREPALGLEQLDEPVDLVVRRDRDEVVLDHAVLGVGRGAVASKRDGIVACTRARARRPRRRASPRRASSGASSAGARTIRSTCGLKPMSSMRSASSRTRIRTSSSETSSPLDEILQAAGRRDDDVRALEPLRLRARPARRRRRRRRGGPCAAANGAISSATWSASSRVGTSTSDVGVLPSGVRPLDERDAEGERLARAGRRLGEDVAAGERVRQDERLDAERLDDAAGGERLLDRRAHAERAKRLLHMLFDSLYLRFENHTTRNRRRRNEKLNLTGRPIAVRADIAEVRRTRSLAARTRGTAGSRAELSGHAQRGSYEHDGL